MHLWCFLTKNLTNFALWSEILLNWILICFSEKKDLFTCCYVAKQFFWIAYFTDMLSFEMFSKNLHGISNRDKKVYFSMHLWCFLTKNLTNFALWSEILLNWILICFSEKKDLFTCCYVAKQFFWIAYFTDMLSFEMFSKNLHGNLKLIFLFSMLFVYFEIRCRKILIA